GCMPTKSLESADSAGPDGAESHAELRRWLEAVQALSAAVSAGRGLREVLGLVADTARSLLGFDFCGVLIPDSSGQNLVIEGWSGLSAEYVARVNSDRPVRLHGDGVHHAPSSQAFRSGLPAAVRDIDREPQFTPWGGVAKEQGYRSMLSVPLVAGGDVVGTLNSYHSAVHDFTDHEVERLTLLANHAAIALTSRRTRRGRTRSAPASCAKKAVTSPPRSGWRGRWSPGCGCRAAPRDSRSSTNGLLNTPRS
ncbi:GAF domain-containing protein, partial [Streptomyces sp. MCAF7]